MAVRTQPSRAFRTRDTHRAWLTAHFVMLTVVVLGSFVANRFLSPDRFWAHWVALALGLVFLGHLAVFARATLATMGGKR